MSLDALLLNREAISHVVSALGRYRRMSAKLLASRYSDGECDAVSLTDFAYEFEAIETFDGTDNLTMRALIERIK
jgi:hypothetical protein